jgi:hypothetical protein
MNLLKCSNCESTNGYIQYNNWLVCRECGQASFFDWKDVAKGVKTEIFLLMKDRAELGTTDHQIAASINEAKAKSHLWPIGEYQLTDAEEYAKYYNLFVYLKYGITGVSAAGKEADLAASSGREETAVDSNANGGR